MSEHSNGDNRARTATWTGDAAPSDTGSDDTPTAPAGYPGYGGHPGYQTQVVYPQTVVPVAHYGPVGYVHPFAVVAMPRYSNGLGTTGMILGIIGLVLSWIPTFGFLLGLL